MIASSDSAVFWVQAVVMGIPILGTMIAGLWKLAQRNTQEHAQTSAKLDVLSEKVDIVHEGVRDIRADFTQHLENHER